MSHKSSQIKAIILSQAYDRKIAERFFPNGGRSARTLGTRFHTDVLTKKNDNNIAVYPESLVILNEREGSRAGPTRSISVGCDGNAV